MNDRDFKAYLQGLYDRTPPAPADSLAQLLKQTRSRVQPAPRRPMLSRAQLAWSCAAFAVLTLAVAYSPAADDVTPPATDGAGLYGSGEDLGRDYDVSLEDYTGLAEPDRKS